MDGAATGREAFAASLVYPNGWTPESNLKVGVKDADRNWPLRRLQERAWPVLLLAVVLLVTIINTIVF